MNHSPTLQEHIIETACLLFAEHGYEGIGTNRIATESNVTPERLHLFFSCKDDIYEQVFRKLYDLNNALTYNVLLRRDPTLFDTPEGRVEAVRQVVFDYFRRHVFLEDDWRRKLIRHEQKNPTPLFIRLTEDCAHEESTNLIDLLFLLRSDRDTVDALVWSHIPASQVLFYFNTDGIIERYFDPDIYEELKEIVIQNTAKIMITALGFPVRTSLEQVDDQVISMTV